MKFNPLESGAKADLSVKIDTLRYNRYDYTDVTMGVQLSEGVYNGTIISNCRDLNAALTLN